MNLIQGHDSSLGCFALSFDGKLLATASEKGTLIRIWDSQTGEKIQELRRGADHAEIQSICFSPKTAQWLAVSSDKGTVHIFKILRAEAQIAPEQMQPKKKKEGNANASGADGGGGGGGAEEPPQPADNPKSSLISFRAVLPKYFSSEWSFAQFRVPVVKSIVAFGAQENTIVVVSANGTFYKAEFDPKKGGDCIKKKEADFIKAKAN